MRGGGRKCCYLRDMGEGSFELSETPWVSMERKDVDEEVEGEARRGEKRRGDERKGGEWRGEEMR